MSKLYELYYKDFDELMDFVAEINPKRLEYLSNKLDQGKSLS